MKYYLIAGEASGDLHGSNLLKALRQEDPHLQCRAWGGDLIQESGATLVKHYRDLAFMGFIEVVKNLRTILRNLDFCKRDILEFHPDVLILIDYPGFNLRIAKWAKQNGIRVFYYISPQIWAWHTSRIHGIKASVERMFVILPFEQAFYAQYDMPVDFPGHPLLDVIDSRQPDPTFRQQNQLGPEPIIALLPGSRRQEISRMLPAYLAVIPQFPGYQFVIAGAPSIPDAFYHHLLDQSGGREQAKLLTGQTYQILSHAHAALVTSGTATLETALFQVPEVVCYKGNPLSFLIARRLVNVRFISLVNLILDRLIVTELIQQECTTERIASELKRLLDPSRREEVQADYAQLIQALGRKGASQRAAKAMIAYLSEPNS
ncbi:MAG: Lipid-A-disaccharide synthase [Haliscomenobacter sp.]|jgi:lipid-A-disaccharide synthase|nr:Lipid-A-disaccharide synthase [Haliscomenobacter sp.]